MFQIDFYIIINDDIFGSWFELYETIGSFATLEEAWQVARKHNGNLPYKIRLQSRLTPNSNYELSA